jgi:spermidine synthase
VLYAISNLGSFLALLSYPFLFEAYSDLKTQLNIWRAGYLLLLGLHFVAVRLIAVADNPVKFMQQQHVIAAKEKLRWFLLAAAGVVTFLSVTNIITYEITPAPLLWIMPLCIYLISFVLNFKGNPYCPAWIKDKFHLAIAFSIVLFFLTQRRILPFIIEIIAYSISLFIVCMFCQNELVINKPLDRHNLTVFYLVIAAGSFVGGILVSWVIPLISPSMIEYLLSLCIIYLALIVYEKKTSIGLYYIRLICYVILFIILWPLVFRTYNIFGLILIFFIFKFIYSELKTKTQALYLSLLSILFIAPFVEPFWVGHDYIYRRRNYYGIYKIYERDGIRFLMHGTTLHGAQYVSSNKKETEPLTYYHRLTPVGKLMDSNAFNLKRIGIVGLGAGTLAAYGKPEQGIDFFELDRDVFYIADKYFSYLRKSPAKINYLFGDARISLSKIPPNHYNLLIIDAFSGDSIPIHLLTKEAITEYKNRITTNGIILFHVSNRYLNLVPVLFSNAKALKAYVIVNSNSQLRRELCASVWVALTWNKNSLKHLISRLKPDKKYFPRHVKQVRPWTDLYSNILATFRLNQFLTSLKEFQPFYW